MPGEKYVPQRKCIFCKQIRPKKELIRVVLGSNGLKVDPEGKLPGRGCYVCRIIQCINGAAEKNFFSRNFKKGFTKEELACVSAELKNNI